MIEGLRRAIDFVLHIDRDLAAMIQQYGGWTYGIVFAVIFVETGLVVMPFLPGDSLLFAAGSLAAIGSLSLPRLIGLLVLAAVAGDNVNYFVGRRVGERAFSHDYRWLRRDHLDRTHRFFERFGPRTIILARFVPIVRTFTPFVAGVGTMNYRTFLMYDIVGGTAWVSLFILAGNWFGNLPSVREHFALVILGIVVVSTMPIAVELVRGWRNRRRGIGAT